MDNIYIEWANNGYIVRVDFGTGTYTTTIHPTWNQVLDYLKDKGSETSDVNK